MATHSADDLMKAGAKEIKKPTGEEVQAAYDVLEREINTLIGKVAELDEEVFFKHWQSIISLLLNWQSIISILLFNFSNK